MNILEFLNSIPALAGRVFVDYPESVPNNLFAVVIEGSEQPVTRFFHDGSVNVARTEIRVFDVPAADGRKPSKSRLIDVMNRILFGGVNPGELSIVSSVTADITPGIFIGPVFVRSHSRPVPSERSKAWQCVLTVEHHVDRRIKRV